MSTDEDRHSKLQPVAVREAMSPSEEARQAARNGLKQFDLLTELIQTGIADYRTGRFKLRPSTLMALDRVAVEGMVDGPGHFRRVPIEIGGARHHPPPADDVPRYIDELCEYVNDHWGTSAVHLSAYVMWRLNWIHPFEDGNGRTSRAASYLVLCVRMQNLLPGSPTVPELIARNKQPYYAALEAADTADKAGKLDVSRMETLLEDLLIQQVKSAASGSTSRSTHRPDAVASTRETTKKLTSDPPASRERRGLLYGLIATIVAAFIGGVATLLSTDTGQRFLGCGGGQPTPTVSAEPRQPAAASQVPAVSGRPAPATQDAR